MGVDTGVTDVVPFPICPAWFCPQAQTVPSRFKANAWLRPAEMVTMSVRTVIIVGRATGVPVVPLPV
jgi:hypothetical protein